MADRWFLNELGSVSGVGPPVECLMNFKDRQGGSGRQGLHGWGLLPPAGINLLGG